MDGWIDGRTRAGGRMDAWMLERSCTFIILIVTSHMIKTLRNSAGNPMRSVFTKSKIAFRKRQECLSQATKSLEDEI